MIRPLAAGILAVLLLSACTASTEPPPTRSTVDSLPTTTLVDDDGTQRFRECLALSGVGIAPVETDGTGRPRLDLAVEGLDLSDPAVGEAVADCSEELSTGALDLSSDELLRQVVIDQLHRFSECMRDRGVEDFPDPAPGFTGIGTAYAIAEIPYSDPDLAAVAEVCNMRVLDDLPSP